MKPDESTNKSSGNNTLAVLSVVFAFIFAPVGLILGIIALNKKQSKALAICGIIISILGILTSFIIISAVISVINTVDNDKTLTEKTPDNATQKISEQDKMIRSIAILVNEKQAFNPGSYVKGEIPKGEYAFIPLGVGVGSKYYSEEDSSNNIIDNENFDSFGYVYVHSSGNLETEGVLIKTSALERWSKVDGAKDVYEKLHDIKNYKGSAWYKVGLDIKPGKYTIESFNEAYVAVMSGPLGNSSIINNDNFNGKYSVTVADDQYLVISKGEIK